MTEGEGGAKGGREGVDVVVLVGWVNRRDEIKRLTHTFDPQSSFQLSTINYALLPSASRWMLHLSK